MPLSTASALRRSPCGGSQYSNLFYLAVSARLMPLLPLHGSRCCCCCRFVSASVSAPPHADRARPLPLHPFSPAVCRRERNSRDQRSNGGDKRQPRLTTGTVSLCAGISRRPLQARTQSASHVRRRAKEYRELQLLGAGVPTASVRRRISKVWACFFYGLRSVRCQNEN